MKGIPFSQRAHTFVCDRARVCACVVHFLNHTRLFRSVPKSNQQQQQSATHRRRSRITRSKLISSFPHIFDHYTHTHKNTVRPTDRPSVLNSPRNYSLSARPPTTFRPISRRYRRLYIRFLWLKRKAAAARACCYLCLICSGLVGGVERARVCVCWYHQPGRTHHREIFAGRARHACTNTQYYPFSVCVITLTRPRYNTHESIHTVPQTFCTREIGLK